jgi:hypothetical protein
MLRPVSRDGIIAQQRVVGPAQAMARKLPLPVTIAALDILAAAVLAVGLSAGYRWSIGGFASVGASAPGYAQDLEAQLCKLGAAVTDYSATNDAQRFYATMSETWQANRRTFTDSRHYIESLKKQTEAKTPEGYVISRTVEQLWEATNATERVIGSAYSWSDDLRKSPVRPISAATGPIPPCKARSWSC